MRQVAWVAAGLLALLAITALAAGRTPAAAPTGQPGAVQIQVVANSDSAADQRLKLAVRDEAVALLGPRLSGLGEAQGRQVLADSLDELAALAARTVAEAGLPYGASVELGPFQHDGRQYGPLVAPAGEHELLRISLGEAAGHNWWCVLLPPVCFAPAGDGFGVIAEEDLADLLVLDADGQWALRTGPDAVAPPRLRLAVLEWLRQLDTPARLAWLRQLLSTATRPAA